MWRFCSATCDTPEEEVTCSEEGCFCPNGTVLHEGRCIRRDECPCVVDGNVLQTNEVIKMNCMEW